MAADKEVDQETGRDNASDKEASDERRLSDDSLDLLRDQSSLKDSAASRLNSSSADKALVNLEIYDAKASLGDAPPESEYRSDIDGYRDRLIQAGIDPDKVSVRVGVRELNSADPRNQDFADSHALTVACAMKDPEFGLSRDMRVKMIKDTSSDLTDLPDEPGKIAERIAHEAREVLDSFNKTLREQFLDPNNKEPLRVINASNGGTPADFGGMIFNRFREDPDKYANSIKQMLGEEKGQQWIDEQKKLLAEPKPEEPEPTKEEQDARANITCADFRDRSSESELSPAPEVLSENSREMLQKLVSLAEKAIADDPKFKESLERYQQTTREVAERGGIIVIAAANSGEFEAQTGVKLQPGSQYNFLGMSDHVITVGSSETNKTPGDHSDDRIAAHSSTGTERFAPTVVAQGVDLPSRQMPDGKVGGTSIAAPIVANVVALMLTQNPDLTFDQVKQLLRENSRFIPGASPLQQGAGVLLADQAIIAARASRR